MKRAFDHCADEYARYRLAYPAGVFEVLEEAAGEAVGPCRRRAADVGAGTGIFARQLSAHGWRVVAVDPSAAMLRHATAGGEAGSGGGVILRVCASAEETGLAGGSVELVAAAQAFHWFNPPYALAEFARVLTPGGILALVWNNRDASRSAFVEAYESLIARYNPGYRREYRQQDWAGKIAAGGAFEPARYDGFDHEWRPSVEEFVGFSRSVSYIRNVLSREDRPRFEDDLCRLVRENFGDGACHIAMHTDLWTARRVRNL